MVLPDPEKFVRRTAPPAIACLIVAVALTGCVQRRFTVRSNVPGALVYIDNQEIGETPVSVPFTYYGTRDFRLVKDGFETLSVQKKFSPPWYEWPVIDFVSENLIPWEMRDERAIDFQLVPQQAVPRDQLMQRAEALRKNAQEGYVTPLPQLPMGTIGTGDVPAAQPGYQTLTEPREVQPAPGSDSINVNPSPAAPRGTIYPPPTQPQPVAPPPGGTDGFSPTTSRSVSGYPNTSLNAPGLMSPPYQPQPIVPPAGATIP